MAVNKTLGFTLNLLVAALVMTCWSGNLPATPGRDSGTGTNVFEIGGFLKSDLVFSDFSAGPVSDGSLGRDLYVPGAIPASGVSQRYIDMHGKESRINFSASRPLQNGEMFKAFVEVDFLKCSAGTFNFVDTLRLRHAFVQYGDWLAGQTWTTLFNVSALPENLDFIGPSESTIFRRHQMIRYSHGPWQFALENPRSTITPYGGGARINRDDQHTPDMIVRYNHEGEDHTLTVAAIMRQLAYRNTELGFNENSTGYGISLSGKINIGELDDFRWMANAGSGLGHYIGLNIANGVVINAAGELENIASSGLFGSYRHFWNEKLRSNLTLGYIAVKNDLALSGESVTENASSLHLNLIWKARPALDLGAELIFADRKLEDGSDGQLTRLQFSAKYAY